MKEPVKLKGSSKEFLCENVLGAWLSLQIVSNSSMRLLTLIPIDTERVNTGLSSCLLD